ncbi:MAG: helix-turn-helix transcriptional regulator [Lachnospiraceae bacterium]|nr:helix-turn-helix transcriptional regulator [Lachnospiraceae bacterium]
MYSLTSHEKRQHGTLEFPVAYYYVDAADPQYQMALHWHKEWEIIRILEGSFILQADEEELVANAGDFLLIRDGMLHGGTPQNCVYECLVFDLHGLFRSMELIKKHLRPVYRLKILPKLHYRSGADEKLHALVDELMHAFAGRRNVAGREGKPDTDTAGKSQGEPVPEPQELYEMVTVSCLGNIFAYILQMELYGINSAEAVSSHRIGQIKSVLEYVELHYQQQLTLEELAAVANMNPKYFCRIFREITRQTPMDYVISYRIEQAAKLLSTTELSILETAIESGFNDCSYFIRTFKRLKNTTPGQYRRSNPELRTG